MKKKIIGIMVGALAAVGIAVPALALASFTNGSFETGPDPGTFTTLSAGDTSISGWKVKSGTIDYIGTYWQASNGSRSLDMSGNGAGAISQTFSTVAGHNYTVDFDMAGNPDGAPTVKTMDVDTGGAPTTYSFDTTGHDKTNMGWQTMTYVFTATGSNTALTFTSDDNTAYGPALDNVTVDVNPPTNKDQCKNDGWKEYTNPSFKNQGQCIDFVQAEAEGHLRMANPSQKIDFEVSNKQKGHVEYSNFDYPEGSTYLHYKAAVTCAFVNPKTKEARFMFQIPPGHPGLSGLYVVAYVKEVKNGPDLYGHEATSDQNTAMEWCQTGAGFSPTFYTVTDGHVEVETN